MLEGDSNFKTPGQIVTQFRDRIIPSVRNGLNGDERFINFGKEWFLREFLVDFSSDELDKVHRVITLRRELPADNILKEVINITCEDKLYKSTVFSLNCTLRDKKKRFIYFTMGGEKVIWSLAPPPKEISFTLTIEALYFGYIKVSSGLKKILDYYQIGQDITFVTYGDYEIKGTFEEFRNIISGQGIRSWYEENRLHENDRIFIKCPEKYGGPLRLYTYHEKPKDEEDEEHEITKDRIYLRDEIYQTLKSEK